jgi:hypothetical protein
MEEKEPAPKIELRPFQGFTEDPPTTQLEDGRMIHWNAPLFRPLTLGDMAPTDLTLKEQVWLMEGKAVEAALQLPFAKVERSPHAGNADEAPGVPGNEVPLTREDAAPTEGLLPAPVPHPHARRAKAMPTEVTADSILAARALIGENIEGTFLDVDWESDFAPLLLHVDSSKIQRVLAAREIDFNEYYRPPVDPQAFERWREGWSCSGQVWFALYEDTEGLFHFVAVVFNECCLTDPPHELVANHASRDFATLWNEQMDADDRYLAYEVLYEVQEWLNEVEV